jgi:succinate-semialdehyde dehydrogenase/glutarate-semialdehyde dehydrogenase
MAARLALIVDDNELNLKLLRDVLRFEGYRTCEAGTAESALALANSCDTGLAAYLYTRDLARAMRLTARIEAGMVAVNRGRVSCVAAPFGGIKHSGFGHSGGVEGIDEYLVTRYLTLPAPGGWSAEMGSPSDGRSVAAA